MSGFPLGVAEYWTKRRLVSVNTCLIFFMTGRCIIGINDTIKRIKSSLYMFTKQEILLQLKNKCSIRRRKRLI